MIPLKAVRVQSAGAEQNGANKFANRKAPKWLQHAKQLLSSSIKPAPSKEFLENLQSRQSRRPGHFLFRLLQRALTSDPKIESTQHETSDDSLKHDMLEDSLGALKQCASGNGKMNLLL